VIRLVSKRVYGGVLSRVFGGEGHLRTTRTTMASIVLGQILDKFAGDFTEYLDCILTDIASEYKLDLEELQGKYLRSEFRKSTPAAKKKKVESDEEGRGKCEAKTAKGQPCKNNALAGMKFCQCHNKDKKAAPKKKAQKKSDSESGTESEAEAPPAPRKAALKKVAQKHSHDKVIGEQENCEMCETLGNPEIGSSSTNPKMDANVQKQLDSIFKKMDEPEESESEDEQEIEDPQKLLQELFENSEEDEEEN